MEHAEGPVQLPVRPPMSLVALYTVMAEPPLLVGAVKVIVIWPHDRQQNQILPSKNSKDAPCCH